MNIIIEKYRQLEKELGEYLDQLNQKPPFGFGQFLKPLNQSFQLCRVLGQQMQAQHKRITELEEKLAQGCQSFSPIEVCLECNTKYDKSGSLCSNCNSAAIATVCEHQPEAANDE